MESFTAKLKIGNLEGKVNWAQWKYKVSIMLRGTECALEAAEGKIQKPTQLSVGAGDAEVGAYNLAMAKYRKADSNALLIITTSLSDDTLNKIMRFETAKEVWEELHRLFDGQSEDRAYNLCMEFFGFKRDKGDDVSTHMSKLKNIWNNLNAEINKSDTNIKLPELFLICKILETLDEKYFSFKSSWLLINKKDRTIESLTSHLCAYERALSGNGETSQEALVINKTVQKKKKQLTKCHYCSESGHWVKTCPKWIRDGRPPKTPKIGTGFSPLIQNITLMIVNACSSEQSQDKGNWFIDSGATVHITNRSDIFQDFVHFDLNHTVTTADGTTIPAKGKGSVVVESNINRRKELITLSNVWYVPSLTRNLFSTLAAQDMIQNSVFTSTATECKLVIDGITRVIGIRKPNGGLYKLNIKALIPDNHIQVNVVTSQEDLLQIYHERFGHQNPRHVKNLVKRELGIDINCDGLKCEGCIYGKTHRLKFGKRERASSIGELIHTDVCGPFEESFSKYKYFVLFKDDFSSFKSVYFIRQKSEVNSMLVRFIAETKANGHSIKTILSDNGGEFDNKDFRDILHKHGIIQRLTMPYTPEQNGVSERENRTLVEAARSMMHSREELPQKLWAELINTATYVLNRTGPSRVENKVPFELWHGKKPKISHLRIIGSECYAHVPKQKRKKLSKKAVKGILIGYENDDGYRIWDGHQTQRSRDVTFYKDVEYKIPTNIEVNKPNEPNNDLEGEEARDHDLETEDPELGDNRLFHHDLEAEDPELEGDNSLFQEERTEDQHSDNEDQNLEGDRDIPENDLQRQDNFFDAEDIDPEETIVVNEPRYNLRDRNTLRPPKKYEDFVCLVESFPDTFKDAIQAKDSEHWLQAMKSEINSLRVNDVWTLSELPPHRKALPSKWVFRIKRNPDGSTDKYKARLVVKGFKQRLGVDYDQTFSPVARMGTIRALISVAAKEKLVLTQFDVSTAFLYGKLKEEIYMEQPDGFNDGSTKVWKLKRSLYGLKQAPRCWNSCFGEILLDLDFKQSDADSCLFVKETKGKKVLITLYVDDGLVAATDAEVTEAFLNELRKKLKITTKPASYYLGLEIERDTDGSITIKQESYTKKILERFHMSDCNPLSTPIQKESVISTLESGKVDSERKDFPYREAVGALAYLMVGTRPDIAYAVSVASRKLENPDKSDWQMVKKIFRYLKGTTSFGIKYKADHSNDFIVGYSDADHGGDQQTGRSTTGVLSLYAGGAVSWLSQRQASVAISTTEAEIVAASEATRELIWLQRIFTKLTELKVIPTLLVDNEAAIRLAQNPEFHKRTKHIRIRHFFVREKVLDGELLVKRTSTTNQLADMLTKAMPRPRLVQLRSQLGLVETF